MSLAKKESAERSTMLVNTSYKKHNYKQNFTIVPEVYYEVSRVNKERYVLPILSWTV